MSNIIKPKRSSIAGKVPTTSDITSGEIAINSTDLKFYTNNGTSVVQIGAGVLSSLGDATITTPTANQALIYNGTKWINNTSTGTGNSVLATGPSLSHPTIADYEYVTPTTAPTYAQGNVWYDSSADALAYYNSTTNNVVHMGQEIQQQVRNATGSTITKGTIVYLSGATGQIATITKAIATSERPSQAIGVANQDIPNNTNGYIVVIGLVTEINTSAFSDGDILFLSTSTAGAFTNVEPTAPNYVTYMGQCVYSHAIHGKIFIFPQPRTINNNYIVQSIVTKTSAYTITLNDDTVLGNATSAAFTVTLPTSVGNTGKKYVIKKVDSSTNAVTIGTTSSQTIDGNTTYALSNQWGGVTLQSDGSNWLIIGNIFGRNGTTGTF